MADQRVLVGVAGSAQNSPREEQPERKGLLHHLRHSGTIHGLDRELERDDKGLWSLVFPRAKPAGTLDPTAKRYKPFESAEKIFNREKYRAEALDMGDAVNSLRNKDVVTEEEYQKIVRQKILEICDESGFKVSTFDSIDNDETFLVIDMQDGKAPLLQMAVSYSCKLPYKPAAYEKMGMHEPSKHVTNMQGAQSWAYGVYHKDTRTGRDELEPDGGWYEDFRRVDKMRLVQTRLNQKMSLEWLLEQGVICAYFPVSEQDTEDKIAQKWVLRKGFWLEEMALKDNDQIRNYFGEDITLFFRWVEFYTYFLIPLAIAGMCAFFARLAFPEYTMYIRIAFSVVLIVWIAIFNQLFVNQSARAQQLWGMDDYQPPFNERAHYDVKLEMTFRLTCQKLFVTFMQMVFAVGFVAIIAMLKHAEKTAMEAQKLNSPFVLYQSYMTVAAIKLTNILWTKLAPWLVSLQNPRTQKEYEEVLAQKLAGVQIFVSLWNFIYLAFIRKHEASTCLDSVEAIAKDIWGRPGTDEQMAWLQEKYTYKSDSQWCCLGCFPATALDSIPGGATNCDMALTSSLGVYFITHVVSTLVGLIVPIILMRMEISKEVAQAGETASYSILQMQAKRFKLARFEFGSYGGSLIDDYMQFAIGLTLITSFGMLLTPLAFFAFICTYLEYRLLAYRMVRITSRPSPKGARGIGVWQDIFSTIAKIAIVMNTGLAVYEMAPIRNWSWGVQLGLFIGIEHILIFVYSLISGMIPDQPYDVLRIRDYNNTFLQRFEEDPKAAEEDRMGYENADIALTKGGELGPTSSAP